MRLFILGAGSRLDEGDDFVAFSYPTTALTINPTAFSLLISI
jgi:hypothetical protein